MLVQLKKKYKNIKIQAQKQKKISYKKYKKLIKLKKIDK